MINMLLYIYYHGSDQDRIAFVMLGVIDFGNTSFNHAVQIQEKSKIDSEKN